MWGWAKAETNNLYTETVLWSIMWLKTITLEPDEY